jgi:hypothetical protein
MLVDVSPMRSVSLAGDFADPDLEHWSAAYYGPNYHRLTRVKAKYDPSTSSVPAVAPATRLRRACPKATRRSSAGWSLEDSLSRLRLLELIVTPAPWRRAMTDDELRHPRRCVESAGSGWAGSCTRAAPVNAVAGGSLLSFPARLLQRTRVYWPD